MTSGSPAAEPYHQRPQSAKRRTRTQSPDFLALKLEATLKKVSVQEREAQQLRGGMERRTQISQRRQMLNSIRVVVNVATEVLVGLENIEAQIVEIAPELFRRL